MAKVLVFEVKINGIRGAVTGVGDLQEAVKGTRNELKNTDFGTKKYQEVQKQLGALKEVQKDVSNDTRRAGREFVIQADKGKESYRALNAELVNLRDSFKNLSRADREGSVGAQTTKRIQELDKELKSIDASIGNYQRNVGNYGSALEALGGINFVELATLPGAILAGAQAARQAAEFVFELSERFRKLRGEVKTFTDATGPELDSFTARVAGIADTFKESETEILSAARNVADQFDIPFSEALTRIEEGFIGGSNANADFLDLSREYGPVFNEIGASADQAFAFINRTVTAGIFSDQGLATIEEATLRLRELPQATLDALGAIGITAEDIETAISERGIAGAIADVSTRLQDFGNDSREVGVILADVFGGAGEKAGADFVKSLADIETATGSVIDETNEYQVAQLRTLEVNQAFAAVQNEVSKELAGTTGGLANISTIIQTKLLEVLLVAIDLAQRFWAALLPVREALARLGEALGIVDSQGRATEKAFAALNVILEAQEFLWNLAAKAISFVIDRITDLVRGGQKVLEFFGLLDSEAERAAKSEAARSAAARARAEQEAASAEKAASAEEERRKAQEKARKQQEAASAAARKAKKDLDDLTESTKKAGVAADDFAAGSIKALREEVTKLGAELQKLSPENQQGTLKELLKAEEALAEAEQYQKQLREALTRDRIEIPIAPVLESTGLPGTVRSQEEDPMLVALDTRLENIEAEKLARIEAAREVAATEEEFARQRGLIELEAAQAALEARKSEAQAGSIDLARIEQELADTTADINRAKIEELIRQEQARAQQLREIEQLLFGSLQETLSAASAASQARTDGEIGDLEDRYDRELEMAEGNEELQAQLRQELADKREVIEKKEFERQKQFRVATALTSLAEGIVNILSAPTTIPDPFGSIFKGVRIGVLTTTTAAQIAQINKQRAARGWIADAIERRTGTKPKDVRLKAGTGSLVGQAIRGATHQDPSGGVELLANGHRVLAEAGEFVDIDEYGGIAIINKRSTTALRGQLEANAGQAYPGKRAFLSAANAYKNYGITFAQEGALARPNIEPIISESGSTATITARATFTDDQVSEMAERIAGRTAAEVKGAIGKGVQDANRRIEREQRLADRTGRA